MKMYTLCMRICIVYVLWYRNSFTYIPNFEWNYITQPNKTLQNNKNVYILSSRLSNNNWGYNNKLIVTWFNLRCSFLPVNNKCQALSDMFPRNTETLHASVFGSWLASLSAWHMRTFSRNSLPSMQKFKCQHTNFRFVYSYKAFFLKLC